MTWTAAVAIPAPPSPASFAQPELPVTPTFGRGSVVGVKVGLGLNDSSSHRLRSSVKTNDSKRKVILKVEIPKENDGLKALEMTMGSDGRREVLEEGLGFAVFCKRGRKRLHMEDRHLVVCNEIRSDKTAIFGIFDGHGGINASEFCAKNMGNFILNELENLKPDQIEEAVRLGYIKTDAEFLKEKSPGGACCVTALIHKGNLVISNAGDCRAVLSMGGRAEALTSDHKLSRLDERERLEKLGAFVQFRRGTWRLQGSLAVSRGIGDGYLKQFIKPDPESRILKIKPGTEFLILASDGLWDKVENQEAVDLARPFCIGGKNNENNCSVVAACKQLVDLAITRGSTDDTSVMIILLGEFANN